MTDINVLSGSEAVYGLLAWLTTRDTPVTFHAKLDASVAAELAKEFCEVNNLPSPREDWAKNLTHPSEQVERLSMEQQTRNLAE